MAATGGSVGTILAAGERDYLIRNSGEQVKISSIEGGIVALYFSSWCPPGRRFTPKLFQVYKELASHGKSFEVVFVSGDRDEESFNDCLANMPWLAVPFSDSEGRKCLDERFEVSGIPHLIILDAKTGQVLPGDGVEFVSKYGAEAYPFTPERISELKEQGKAAKDNHTIHSVLGTPDRNYVVSNKGDKVPISDLEGKYIGLFFVVSGYHLTEDFTTVLAKLYGKLKEVGEKFEVIAVSLDSDEASFNERFSSMPWLAIPHGDKKCLVSYAAHSFLPTVVLIGPDGKILNRNIVDIIDEHGMAAWEWFPFNAEKLAILAEKAKAKAASQTLESLLVSGDLDFVIKKDGAKVSVSELAGKTVLLYFSEAQRGPCRDFLPPLVDVYNKITENNSDFEIVFISRDRDMDQSSFDEFFSGMPWLALPLGDEREAYLSKMFKTCGIPSLVAIGPSGKTVSTDVKDLIAVHGADAFPFTKERLQELEKKIDEMAKGWPEKLKHELHEHELVLTRHPRPYYDLHEHELELARLPEPYYHCDRCGEMGTPWSYYCAECYRGLHTSCALGEEKKGEEEKVQDAAEDAPGGYVCEGDVCRRA